MATSAIRSFRGQSNVTAMPGAAAARASNVRSGWVEAFREVRGETERRAAPLSDEDQVIQSMPDASPTKWHRAHTTWFFEQFLLLPHLAGYRVFDKQFAYLFNSYYVAAGPRHARPERGLVTRPANSEVAAYRAHVDAAVVRLLDEADATTLAEVLRILEIGLHHEQQHQELILTDILHAFSRIRSRRPTMPAGFRRHRRNPPPDSWLCRRVSTPSASKTRATASTTRPRRIKSICGRCESRARSSPMRSGSISSPTAATRRLRSGSRTAGRRCRRKAGRRPAIGARSTACSHTLTLAGLRAGRSGRAGLHVSYYEADAFARWMGKDLPTEQEWEVAARSGLIDDAFDIVWQWTRSAYSPYPGYRAASGALGEYNGKFMVNQMVLRGSSHATPAGHARPTYRNFFYPPARWQFSGLRLVDYGS